MQILTAHILQIVTDWANVNVANKRKVAYGLSIGIFTCQWTNIDCILIERRRAARLCGGNEEARAGMCVSDVVRTGCPRSGGEQEHLEKCFMNFRLNCHCM